MSLHPSPRPRLSPPSLHPPPCSFLLLPAPRLRLIRLHAASQAHIHQEGQRLLWLETKRWCGLKRSRSEPNGGYERKRREEEWVSGRAARSRCGDGRSSPWILRGQKFTVVFISPFRSQSERVSGCGPNFDPLGESDSTLHFPLVFLKLFQQFPGSPSSVLQPPCMFICHRSQRTRTNSC